MENKNNSAIERDVESSYLYPRNSKIASGVELCWPHWIYFVSSLWSHALFTALSTYLTYHEYTLDLTTSHAIAHTSDNTLRPLLYVVRS